MNEQDKLLMNYLGTKLGRYDKPVVTHFTKRKVVKKKVKPVIYKKPKEKPLFGHVLLEVCDKPKKPVGGEFVVGAMSSE